MKRKTIEMFALASALVLGVAAGCGPMDDSNDGNDDNDDSNQQTKEDASFAVATTVLGEESNTTYVRYLDSLDAGEVKIDDARSYAGNATIGAYGDMFFVGSGKSPKITRFNVKDGSFEKNGELSFSQYVDKAPLFSNLFVDETTAYMENQDTGRIIWNPKEMKIQKSETLDPVDMKVDGKPTTAGTRRGTVIRGDNVFQPFYWADADFYMYAPKSKILVYDANTDEIKNVIEAPCPGLGVGTKDSDGNIYFTNWVGPTAAPVIEGDSNAPSPCAVRIDAGETTINESWTRDLEEMTGGREVTAMRMLEGSTAIAAVLDEQKVDPDSDTKPREITYANVFELWRLDLEEGTGSKIEGIGHIAGGFYAFRLDGRMIVTLPDADYASTTGYEIPVEGKAIERFDAKGWVYQMVELQ